MQEEQNTTGINKTVTTIYPTNYTDLKCNICTTSFAHTKNSTLFFTWMDVNIINWHYSDIFTQTYTISSASYTFNFRVQTLYIHTQTLKYHFTYKFTQKADLKLHQHFTMVMTSEWDSAISTASLKNLKIMYFAEIQHTPYSYQFGSPKSAHRGHIHFHRGNELYMQNIKLYGTFELKYHSGIYIGNYEEILLANKI